MKRLITDVNHTGFMHLQLWQACTLHLTWNIIYFKLWDKLILLKEAARNETTTNT